VLEDPEGCVREREPEPSDVCGLHEGESREKEMIYQRSSMVYKMHRVILPLSQHW